MTVSKSTFLEQVWQAINDVVPLHSSEVYSYVPDNDEDPFSDGSLWSFNFFFFNKDLKRICYFTCVSRSKNRRLLASVEESVSFDQDYEFTPHKLQRHNDEDDGESEGADYESGDDYET